MVTASRVFYDQRSSSLLPSPSHRSVVVSCGRYSHVLWLFPSSLQKVQSYGNLPDCGSFCASTEAIIVPHGRLSVLLSICLHIIELWSERNFWNELILLQTGTSGMKRHLCGSGGQRSHWDETSPLSFVGQEVKGQGHTGMKCHFCGSGGQRSHWDEMSFLWVRRSKVTLGWNVSFVGQEVKGHTGMKRHLCGSGDHRRAELDLEVWQRPIQWVELLVCFNGTASESNAVYSFTSSRRGVVVGRMCFFVCLLSRSREMSTAVVMTLSP